eukprot:15430103-Alexandrium_andersonii.AAC.1
MPADAWGQAKQATGRLRRDGPKALASATKKERCPSRRTNTFGPLHPPVLRHARLDQRAHEVVVAF